MIQRNHTRTRPEVEDKTVRNVPLGTQLVQESAPNAVVRRQAILKVLQAAVGVILLSIVLSTLFIVLHNQNPSRSNHIQDCVDPAGQCRYEQRLQNANLLARQTYCSHKYPHGSYETLRKCVASAIPRPVGSLTIDPPPPPPATNSKGV